MSKEVSNYVINKKLNLLFELMIIKADANGSAKRCFPEKYIIKADANGEKYMIIKDANGLAKRCFPEKYEALKKEFEDLKRVNG